MPSVRPGDSSSFNSFVALAIESSAAGQGDQIILARFVVGELAGKTFLAATPDRRTLPAAWAKDKALIVYGASEDDPITDGVAALFAGPVIDAHELACLLIPRLRDHDLNTVVAAMEDFVRIDDATAGPGERLAAVFLGLLDLVYTLDSGVLRMLARLAFNREGLSDLFIEAEAFTIRNALTRPPKLPIQEDYCLPSRNVDGGGFMESLLRDDEATEPDEYQPLDDTRIAGMFEENGLFHKAMETYERRPQQITMTQGVTRAFSDGEFLIAEAGTGTGKSLSYLVPAILWAVENDQRVVVSTNTKNLQEQLFFKDIPFLLKTLRTDFRVTLLKGRSNYICLDRWQQAMAQPDDRLSVEEREAALLLVPWTKETATGDISEHSGFSLSTHYSLWQKINADGGACQRCMVSEECFVNRAREAATQSHLIIINHALLFSDIAADNAVLQEYKHLVIDEAHNFEKVAVQHLTVEVNGWRARTLLRKVYSRDGIETGALATLKWRAERSPMKQVWKDALAAGTRLAIDGVLEIERVLETFFGTVNEAAIRAATDSGVGYTVKCRYLHESVLAGQLAAAAGPLTQRFLHLRDALGRLGETLNEIPASWMADRDELISTLSTTLEGCKRIEEDVTTLVKAEDENTVFWVEASRQGSVLSCTLIGAPLDVADRLFESLFSRMRTVILTSATLAVGTKFTYMVDRLGLRPIGVPRLKALRIGSPFSYQKQALVCVPATFPSPKSAEFQQAVNELIQGLVLAAGRNTLVLFTSYGMLNRAYTELKGPLEKMGVLLLAQGISGTRSLILDRFRQARGAVLLGTDSFWEGIDLPGDALQVVVLVKLPFAVPSDPVIQAQIERIDRAGRNSFMEFLVPEAVIKFRQGFGRLIRSTEDHGAVVVLDQRVIGTAYGKLFLDSLPTGHQVYRTADDLIEGVTRWFSERNSS